MGIRRAPPTFEDLCRMYPRFAEVAAEGFWRSNRDDGKAADLLGISVTAFENLRQGCARHLGLFVPAPTEAEQAAALVAAAEAAVERIRRHRMLNIKSPDNVNARLGGMGHAQLHPQRIREIMGTDEGEKIHYCAAEVEIIRRIALSRPARSPDVLREVNRALIADGFPYRRHDGLRRKVAALRAEEGHAVAPRVPYSDDEKAVISQIAGQWEGQLPVPRIAGLIADEFAARRFPPRTHDALRNRVEELRAMRRKEDASTALSPAEGPAIIFMNKDGSQPNREEAFALAD